MLDDELIEKKRELFGKAFGEKYSLRLLEMETWPSDQGRNLALVSFDFPATMTADRIQMLCEEIAEWLGGSLYGTVDLDFTAGGCSLEMMVEFESDEDVEGLRKQQKAAEKFRDKWLPKAEETVAATRRYGMENSHIGQLASEVVESIKSNVELPSILIQALEAGEAAKIKFEELRNK